MRVSVQVAGGGGKLQAGALTWDPPAHRCPQMAERGAGRPVD